MSAVVLVRTVTSTGSGARRDRNEEAAVAHLIVVRGAQAPTAIGVAQLMPGMAAAVVAASTHCDSSDPQVQPCYQEAIGHGHHTQ